MEYLLFCLALGLFQGLTEFLPVSSSGHLALIEAFFGGAIGSSGNLTALNLLLHAGTLAAVLIVFRRDVKRIAAAAWPLLKKLRGGKARGGAALTYDERTLIALIFGCLPLAALKAADLLLDGICHVGVLDAVDKYVTRSPAVVGGLLIVNGLFLFLADKAKEKKAGKAPCARDGLIVGLWQTVAVLPGISRSGATTCGARFLGYPAEEALRFSFLLSVPAVFGALLGEIPGAFASGALDERTLPALLAGTAAAFAAGLLSIRLLQAAAKRSSFRYFSFCCWGVGAAAIVCRIVLK